MQTLDIFITIKTDEVPETGKFERNMPTNLMTTGKEPMPTPLCVMVETPTGLEYVQVTIT